MSKKNKTLFRIMSQHGRSAYALEIPELNSEGYAKVISAYKEKTPRSNQLYNEALKYLSPSGVHNYGTWHRPYPFFVGKASGSRLFDIDGNEYVDLFMDQGISFLGHNNSRLRQKTEEIMNQLGIHIALNTELGVEYAKRIKKLIPSCERIKVVNTGMEAITLVARIARAHTRRTKIVKFHGHHHGWSDVLSYDELSPGSGDLFAKGVPQNHWENLILLQQNDLDGLTNLLQKRNKEIAAVIMEPLGYLSGAVPFKEGLQKQIRKVTQENGVLLIYDEVATGFRVSIHGAQGILDVKPDLTVLGKIAGGGFPIGVVGGREDVMRILGVLDPRGDTFGPDRVFPMGSFCGHPLALAGGIATMDELEKGDYVQNATSRATEISNGINEAGKDLNMNFSAHTTYSVLHFGLTKDGESDATDITARLAELEFEQMFRLSLLISNPGAVALPGHGYISGIHTKEDVDDAVSAFQNSLRIFKENARIKKKT